MCMSCLSHCPSTAQLQLQQAEEGGHSFAGSNEFLLTTVQQFLSFMAKPTHIQTHTHTRMYVYSMCVFT